jgi:LPS-assembly protein
MRQILLSNGHNLSISSKILGEVYQVSKTSIKNPAAQNSNTKGTAGDYGRFNPQIKAQWSYPLINQFNKSSIILEPTVQFIISPKQHMSSKIPNEDSQNFELSSGNLFSDNRYLGTDIIETGSRINYGVRSTINNLFMSKIGLLAGQSYRLTNSHYPTSSGLQDKLSDYVAQLVYEPLNNLTVIHRIRFDHNNGAINRNEINLAYQYKQLFLSADYHSSSKKALSYADVFSKEISLAAKYNFYQSWWAIGNLRRNIGKKPVGITTNMIENSIGLHYLGQCLNLGVEVKRDYTKLKNVAPNTLYQVKIEIPTF